MALPVRSSVEISFVRELAILRRRDDLVRECFLCRRLMPSVDGCAQAVADVKEESGTPRNVRQHQQAGLRGGVAAQRRVRALAWMLIRECLPQRADLRLEQ